MTQLRLDTMNTLVPLTDEGFISFHHQEVVKKYFPHRNITLFKDSAGMVLDYTTFLSLPDEPVDFKQTTEVDKWALICFRAFGMGWFNALQNYVLQKRFFHHMSWIAVNRKSGKVWPTKENVFRAFRETPYEDLKAAIMMQNPYADDRSTGIAAGIEDGSNASPSLRYLWKSVNPRMDGPMDPSLLAWAKQGVLLLNVSMTIGDGRKGGKDDEHYNGWLGFSRFVVEAITDRGVPIVFMGNKAKEAARFRELRNRGKELWERQLAVEHPIAAYRDDEREWVDKDWANWINLHTFPPINWTASEVDPPVSF